MTLNRRHCERSEAIQKADAGPALFSIASLRSR